jgi:hypothetical protein
MELTSGFSDLHWYYVVYPVVMGRMSASWGSDHPKVGNDGENVKTISTPEHSKLQWHHRIHQKTNGD